MTLIESIVFLIFLIPAFGLKSTCFVLSPNHSQTNGVEGGNSCLDYVSVQDFMKYSWECHNETRCHGFQVRISDGKVSHEVLLDGSKPSTCSAKVGEKCFSFTKRLPLIRPRCQKYSNPEDHWTVIQRRMDGSVNFSRGWKDYEEGFGNKDGEMWIGNRILSEMTSTKRYKLLVSMEDFDGRVVCATYSFFFVGPKESNYPLKVAGYRGNAGDSLSYHNNRPFSTIDADRTKFDCPRKYNGAWWYRSCHSSNLNGLYLSGNHKSFANGVNWKTFKGFYYSLKFTEMKIAEAKDEVVETVN